MFASNEDPYRMCYKWMRMEVEQCVDLESEHIKNIWKGLAKLLCSGEGRQVELPDGMTLCAFRKLVPGCAITVEEMRGADGRIRRNIKTLNRPSWLLGNLALVHRTIDYLYHHQEWAFSGEMCDEYLSYGDKCSPKCIAFVKFILMNGISTGIWCNCKLVFEIVDFIREQEEQELG